MIRNHIQRIAPQTLKKKIP